MPRTTRRDRTTALVLATAFAFGPAATRGAAQTTTITFDGLSGNQSTYVEQGYTVGCASGDTGLPCSTLISLGPSSAAYTGSPNLFNNNVVGVTTLGRVGGGGFDLLSVRLAPFAIPMANGSVVFEGVLAAGGTVSQTFTLALPVGALTTYTFSDAFRGLASVRFLGARGGAAATFIAPVVDDVTVRPTAVVPEPGTWALLATGLLAVGGLSRRRRAA